MSSSPFQPIEVSKAVMDYADAFREFKCREREVTHARNVLDNARVAFEAAWRKAKATAKPGMYRVGRGSSDEGILIGEGDYPPVVAMWDANRGGS